MSKQKTDAEKEISSIVKLDKTAKTPTAKEFHEKAKKGYDVNKTVKLPDRTFKGKTLSSTLRESFMFPNGKSTEDYLDHKEFMEATKKFFEVDFNKQKTLLYDIACREYYEKERRIQEFNSDGSLKKEITIDLEEEKRKWKKYCNLVDKIKPYIDINYPDYKNEQLKYRGILKKSAELFPDSVIEDICIYLQKYNLNQHKQAKVDYLLSLDFPNIDTNAAKKIVDMHYENKKR